MDEYTQSTQEWLDARFRETDEHGVYIPHQPIYGLRTGPREPGALDRYVISYQIMQALSRLQFDSLLDIGGAEGYKSGLARELFGVSTHSCDLSSEACRRAKEIYGITGEPVDIHRLPFSDNQFDVVLCSETLEHVHQIEAAARELLRVAAKAVVITVPHEPQALIDQNIANNIPHGHIHALNKHSFDYLKDEATLVQYRQMLSRHLRIPSHIVDAHARADSQRYPGILVTAFNSCLPLLRILTGNRTARLLMRLDAYCSARSTDAFGGMLFVLAKDPGCWLPTPHRLVTTRDVTEFTVPLHHLSAI